MTDDPEDNPHPFRPAEIQQLIDERLNNKENNK